MKIIATYTTSVEELTDKIGHIVDNYMFENKADQADIRDFVYDGMEFDKVKIVNSPKHGKEIGFVHMRYPDKEPLMLNDLVNDARLNGVDILENVLLGCRSLYQGSRVLSTVGTHQFLKNETIISIHKDLHGRFLVLDKGKERSLLHPFGREFVTLRDLRNTDRRPFKIYPSKMKDVTIAVIPRINNFHSMTSFEDVNKELNQFPLKDFDIALTDHIVLSPEDFNSNIENQYSSTNINKISVRNGQIKSFHMKDTHEIRCLSKSGVEKLESVVKSKMIYLRKFASETVKEQERERLFEKSRDLQDNLAKLVGMEVGKTIIFDRGIPLDDNVVVESIGDMVVNNVTYLAKPHGHAQFTVSDGEREIPFSRMMEWNQEQVAEAVTEQIKKKTLAEETVNVQEENLEAQTYDSLEYDGKKWPLRSLVLPTSGEQVLVGTVALEQALLPDDGHAEWKDRKAQSVDERIFYYVEDGEINLSSKELAALVECEALDIEKEETVHDSVDNNEDDRLLSDADIRKQYSDFKISGILFYKQTQPDAWSGVVDLEFPNADHPDLDNAMTNPFISYDADGKKIAFDHWMPEETYKGVCDYIRQERPKYLITEAIINRTIDSSAKQFLPEQQQMILDFLKKFETVDQKMQALSPLWDEACKDKRMNVYDEWKESVKVELNDLASGVIRDNSRGLIP